MDSREAITEALALIFQGIEKLKSAFPHRQIYHRRSARG
jgi:hypothetical protein